MEKYNYYEAVKNDVLKAIQENNEFLPQKGEDRGSYHDRIKDELWESKVTGNEGDSYYYSEEKDASASVKDNLDLCYKAYDEFGINDSAHTFMLNMQYADTIIRCYVLYSAIDFAIDEMGFFNEEED